MSNIQIPNLPSVLGLSGPELFECVQAGTSMRVSFAQMLAEIQPILYAIATQQQAEQGTNNTALMTPLRTAQAIAYQAVDASKLTTGTLAAARLPQFTAGDVFTASAGSATLSLTTTGVSAGTWTKVTVDTKGRVTTGANVANTEVPVFTGATGVVAGTRGGVPAPAAADNVNFLTGAATWAYPNDAAKLTTGTLPAARLPQYTGGTVTSPSAGSVVLSLTNSGTSAGTFTKFTVGLDGRITNAVNQSNTDIPAFTGANGVSGGTLGGVPAPVAADNVRYLRGDGTWAAAVGTTDASLLTSGTLAAARLPAFSGVVTTSVGSSVTSYAAGLISSINTISGSGVSGNLFYLTGASAAGQLPSQAIRYINKIFNPAFTINQYRSVGTTVDISVSGGYVLDGFAIGISNSGTLRCSQVASVTPGGSPNRLRVVVQTSDGTVNAGDYAAIAFGIEGNNFADMQFGTANAVTFNIGFYVNMPAGTYHFASENEGGTRSYVIPFTISGGQAGTNVFQSFTIPGDTSGTWTKTNSLGIRFRICLVAGTTFQTATLNAWQNGQFFAGSSQSNFCGTASATAELMDTRLYQNSFSLVAWFEVPNYVDELQRCQRYITTTRIQSSGVTANGIGNAASGLFYPPMMTTPSANVLSDTSTGSIGTRSFGVIDNTAIYAFATGNATGGYNLQCYIQMKAELALF